MKYSKILLKLSGESLGDPGGKGLDYARLTAAAQEIKSLCDRGVKVAVVIGGGNIFRGLQGAAKGFDRVVGDKMGMLATTINSLALVSVLQSLGQAAEVFTATPMLSFGTYYNVLNARERLAQGVVTVISGGTANPFFTTDSASALRAIELGVDVFFKGTRVDGVYSADPEKDPTAVKYDRLTFDKALQDRLRIMDQTAFTLCRENNMPIVVYNMTVPGNVLRLIEGQEIGTYIHA